MKDRTWISKEERYEVIPERELNALKAKNTSLVEAVEVLMRDEILNDFDGGYLAHHEWVRRYAEQVGIVQDALAAQEEA